MTWNDPTEAWFDFLGGRKFVMGMTLGLCGFTLALLGKLSSEFTIVIVSVMGFFAGANVMTTNAALKAGATTQPETTFATESTMKESTVTTSSSTGVSSENIASIVGS